MTPPPKKSTDTVDEPPHGRTLRRSALVGVGRRQRRRGYRAGPMRFTEDELTEIRSAFRQRIKTEPSRKRPARRKRKPEPLPALVREPDYGDAEILTPAQVAEQFAVTSRTVRHWTDSGTLPSFRTVGGQRRFRWGEIRRVVA
jgi:excisionase family DNA binding protein